MIFLTRKYKNKARLSFESLALFAFPFGEGGPLAVDEENAGVIFVSSCVLEIY